MKVREFFRACGFYGLGLVFFLCLAMAVALSLAEAQQGTKGKKIVGEPIPAPIATPAPILQENSDKGQVGRYQAAVTVSATHNLLVVCDTTTGECWTIRLNNTQLKWTKVEGK